MARPDEPPRLKPEMASRRLLVLAFVRDYIGSWGESPSYGEIAAGCGITVDHARKLVKRLVAGGLLLRTPGPRGLALPSDREDAIRRLRALGYTVDEAERRASDAANRPLRRPIRVHYVPSQDCEGGGDGTAAVDQDAGGASQALGEGPPDPSD